VLLLLGNQANAKGKALQCNMFRSSVKVVYLLYDSFYHAVQYSKDHKGIGVAHEQKTNVYFSDDDGAVFVRP